MKNIAQFSFYTLILLHALSCNDFLSDAQPADQLPINEVFQTGNDLETGIIGLYDLIQQRELLGAYIPSLAEYLPYNVIAPDWARAVGNLQIQADHWMPEVIWREAYRAINQANAILDALPDVMDKDATISSQAAARMEGEALFIRSVLFFELVRIYARPYGENSGSDLGIPILLKPILGRENLQFPARSSVSEVYSQIINDLSKAQEKLPQEMMAGRATYFAATAYLARVFFQRKEYEMAVELAEVILERDDLFKLNPSPEEFYISEGSSEEIWVVPSSSPNDHIVQGMSGSFRNAEIYQGMKNTYASILNERHKESIEMAGNSWQAVDLRCDPDGIISKHPIVINDTEIEEDTLYCHKYESEAVDTEDDTPNARLAEFILLKAEALAHVHGINLESIELLNQIRRRSIRILNETGAEEPNAEIYFEYRNTDFQNKSQLIDAIQMEKRVELAFEGHYFHDLMRLGKDVINGDTIFNYYADKLRFPIPQREIDANPNLVQNLGY